MQVWIVDDDASIRFVLERALARGGFETRAFGSGDECLQALAGPLPAALITDVRMRGTDGLALLARLRERAPQLPVIVMTAHSDLESAVAAFEAGAFEYLPKPFDVDELVALVRRAAQDAAGTARREAAASTAAAGTLIGESPAMQEVFRAIGRLARSSVTVLITGESGTGKELVARALHRHSPRTQRPFVALNTAAIPAELLESELFGHERGAFTGAHAQRRGRFEQADGGTLFLDEIGDMPLALQTRLLRVLAEGEFYRVGGVDPVRVDVRIIAATHQDLSALVAQGRFREDLYHRLNVVRLHVPPLRARRGDIPLLARHFMRECARELGTDAKRLTPAAEAVLAARDWPGNVRELRNLCHRLTALAPGHEIDAADIPADAGHGAAVNGAAAPTWRSALTAWFEQEVAARGVAAGCEVRRAVERALIEAALAASGGQRQAAARLLGWGRNTLARKLRAHALDTAAAPQRKRGGG